jgi:hypothetical protein
MKYLIIELSSNIVKYSEKIATIDLIDPTKII